MVTFVTPSWLASSACVHPLDSRFRRMIWEYVEGGLNIVSQIFNTVLNEGQAILNRIDARD